MTVVGVSDVVTDEGPGVELRFFRGTKRECLRAIPLLLERCQLALLLSGEPDEQEIVDSVGRGAVISSRPDLVALWPDLVALYHRARS